MRHKIDIAACLLALMGCAVLLSSGMSGQNAPALSLADQLNAQYKLVKMGSDANGLTVVDPGTVLAIQKGGILGASPQSVVMCPSKFQDGQLKAPGVFCSAMVKDSRYLKVGEKVYPTKIDVNLDKDKVTIQVVECDFCNGVEQPSFYKSQVVFQFAKGSLKNMSVPQVEDTIGQVLAIDTGESQQDANTQPQNQEQNQEPAPAPQAQPQTIELGQTPQQVVAAVGQPDKIVNLGTKLIYIYKDMKVTFLNGKVTDVQ